MKIISVQFSNISNQNVLRLDAHYRYFFDIKNALSWESYNSIELSQVITPLKSKKIEKGYLDIKEQLIDLVNIDRRYNHLSNVSLVSEIGSDKTRIHKGDIVIPKIQPRLGKLFINENHKKYIGSSELIEYKCNNNIFKVKFLFYLLTHPVFQESLLYTESGKNQRRVSPNDLLRYMIPNFPLVEQEVLLITIKKVEEGIEVKRKNLKSITETINAVFSNHFCINFFFSDKLRKELIYTSCLSEVANDELKFDISLKYRKLFRDNVFCLPSMNWIPLDKIVKVKGGKRLPKGEDVTPEYTGYKYIRVDDLDDFGNFDIDNIQYISEKNHKIIDNYIVKKNDILLTIVGATVGKSGVVPEALDGKNFSENFARLIIKDKDTFSPYYILYVLMSKIGQYQIEEYKGRGSQGKLAIFRIKKIQIPDISLSEQELIVNQIHSEVENQKRLIGEMDNLRKKIDIIISDAIAKIITQ